jgi:hypothetical protein
MDELPRARSEEPNAPDWVDAAGQAASSIGTEAAKLAQKAAASAREAWTWGVSSLEEGLSRCLKGGRKPELPTEQALRRMAERRERDHDLAAEEEFGERGDFLARLDSDDDPSVYAWESEEQ